MAPREMAARSRLTVLFAAFALVGCDAKVSSFALSSGHVCAGDHVDLSWNVTGRATMNVTPPTPGAPSGDVGSRGRATIAPTADTTINLHVSRFLGSSTNSVQEIHLDRPEPLAASLADADATPACANGRLSAVVHARHFAPDVKVTTVTSRPGDDRSYDIEHAGAHATVLPNAAVTQLRASPIAGDWTLSTPLRGDETCQTVTVATLGVLVFTECAAGGTP